MKLLTAAQMRAIDQAAIDEYGIPSIVLMENAGRAVAALCAELLLDRGGRAVRIFAGRGNNGGDGFVVARHLHNSGCDVAVALLASPDDLQGDAATNHAIAARLDIPIALVGAASAATTRRLREMAQEADLIVDAVLGTGLTGEVQGVALDAIRAMNEAAAPTVAVDIPSGVLADTGAAPSIAVQAEATVTFGWPKIGLYQYPGAACAGVVRTADIGLPEVLAQSPELQVELATPTAMADLLPPRSPAGHKGDFGRVAVIAGSVGYTGACALAANGAMRAGAGLVTMAAPSAIHPIVEGLVTEAIGRPLPSTPDGSLAAEGLDELLALAEASDAVVIGPGLSQNPETQDLIRALAARSSAPLVIDADGLNALAADPSPLSERQAPTVLTPHPGEFARLRGCDIADVQSDRVSAATAAAAEFDAVVVLKGAGTVTADPAGRVYVNPTGNEGLASGGTGDVLSGMIGALIAGGCAPFDAAALGVFWHGLAADVVAEERDPRTLVAGDLLEALSAAARILTGDEPSP